MKIAMIQLFQLTSSDENIQAYQTRAQGDKCFFFFLHRSVNIRDASLVMARS